MKTRACHSTSVWLWLQSHYRRRPDHFSIISNIHTTTKDMCPHVSVQVNSSKLNRQTIHLYCTISGNGHVFLKQVTYLDSQCSTPIIIAEY